MFSLIGNWKTRVPLALFPIWYPFNIWLLTRIFCWWILQRKSRRAEWFVRRGVIRGARPCRWLWRGCLSLKGRRLWASCRPAGHSSGAISVWWRWPADRTQTWSTHGDRPTPTGQPIGMVTFAILFCSPPSHNCDTITRQIYTCLGVVHK